MRERTDFCANCRKQAEYSLKKDVITQTVHGKEYSFLITVAVCKECGAKMSIPGLINRNVQEIDEQYRSEEGLISIRDIKKLLELYNIGKAPLSLALGFGEITITRYLEGQIPSKEYSDIMKKALASPAFMKQLIISNEDKLANPAFNKAYTAAELLENSFSISPKMLGVIAYIFGKLEEVTPLMLQKLLYYVQGVYMALYDEMIFVEHCEAWIHGPVYPEVYFLFSDFKYNPIDDTRFSILDGSVELLSENECHVIDLVTNTFGLYGGKTLERITHGEAPWKEARNGYDDSISSNVPLAEESIKEYFGMMHQKYDFNTEDGLNQYIHSMLY